MTAIEKIRDQRLDPKLPLRNELFKAERKLTVLTRHPEQATCNAESDYVVHNGGIFEISEHQVYSTNCAKLGIKDIQGLREHLKASYPSSEKALLTRSKIWYSNLEADETIETLICGDTKEDILKRFFKKDLSLTYLNGADISFADPKLKEDFIQYFYKDSEGIGRYAAMGGNMD